MCEQTHRTDNLKTTRILFLTLVVWSYGCGCITGLSICFIVVCHINWPICGEILCLFYCNVMEGKVLEPPQMGTWIQSLLSLIQEAAFLARSKPVCSTLALSEVCPRELLPTDFTACISQAAGTVMTFAQLHVSDRKWSCMHVGASHRGRQLRFPKGKISTYQI